MTPDLDRLPGLIAAVDAKIAAAGDLQAMDYRQYRAEGNRVAAELRTELGARIREGVADGHAMTLGGVKTSCTSGLFGLLRNWQSAARRKLAEAGR